MSSASGIQELLELSFEHDLGVPIVVIQLECDALLRKNSEEMTSIAYLTASYRIKSVKIVEPMTGRMAIVPISKLLDS